MLFIGFLIGFAIGFFMVLIGLLIYLGYLLFEEMSKKSPEDVGTAPTPTGAV